MASVPPIEWVKLIPADSIPVFSFSPDVLDCDIERIRAELKHFFGERKFLAIRGGNVQIYAIADTPTVSAEGAAWAADEGGVKWS